MLVETLNDQHAVGATDSTVLGPFHMTESPVRQLGDTIDEVGSPSHLLVAGVVRGTDGQVLPNASGHSPIPTDGPVGTLLEATDRHPYRPAHIHFIARTDRYRPLTTHIFIPGSPYLDSDAVFAVKGPLVGTLGTVDADHARRYGVDVGTVSATVKLVLAPEQAGVPDVD